MSGQPSSNGGAGFAALTGGLLARKGEALPAVDADAHAGIDVSSYGMAPANANHDHDGYADNPRSDDNEAAAPTSHNNVRPFRRPAPSSGPATSAAWTIIAPTPKTRRIRKRVRPLKQPTPALDGCNATITFKMPAADLVRMRLAAKELSINCQAVLLDALDCFLEANEIAPVTEAECLAELERIKKRRLRNHQD